MKSDFQQGDIHNALNSLAAMQPEIDLRYFDRGILSARPRPLHSWLSASEIGKKIKNASLSLYGRNPRAVGGALTFLTAAGLLAGSYIARPNDKPPVPTSAVSKTTDASSDDLRTIVPAWVQAVVGAVPGSSIPNPAPPEPIETANQRVLDAGDYTAAIRARHAAEIKREGDLKQLPGRTSQTGHRRPHTAVHATHQ